MAKKFDPSELKILKVRAVGGEGAGTTLAQKVGPLGLPAKKVQEDIAKATIEYKGLRVGVRLIVQNRQATIELCPSTAVQIIKSLKEPPRDRKKEKNIKHHGSLSMDQIITIARTIRPRSFAKTLRGTVREVLGTCSSMGCRVEGENAHDVNAKVLSGEISVPEK